MKKIGAVDTSISHAAGEVDAARGLRYVLEPLGYGKYRTVSRPIAATIKEAQETGKDFFHPEYGWLRNGYQMEKDYPEIVAHATPGLQDADIIMANEGGN